MNTEMMEIDYKGLALSVPADTTHVATDENGAVYSFPGLPYVEEAILCWWFDEEGLPRQIHAYEHPMPDWRDSLESLS